MKEVVIARSIGEVGLVEMNRPEVRNAMNTELINDLIELLRIQRDVPEIRAVVITGAAGVFSAGADVAERVDDAAARFRMELFCDLYHLVTTLPKPTVAAIAGPCIGGGAEVAAGCDLRVGTMSAAIRFPGAQFGIPVGFARLPLLVGLSHAKDLLLTARTIRAEEAFRMGFLNRVVDEGELEHEAVALASTMAAKAGAAQTKSLLDDVSALTARVSTENRALRRWQRGNIQLPAPDAET
jgi:enoyl-CoA hydratase/carnithine racemase